MIAFADKSPPAPPMGEIATTQDGRDITRGYVDALPLLGPQDTVLQLRGGGNLAIYEEVLRDWQVISTLKQRRMALIAKQWDVEPGGQKRRDKQAAESLKAQLEALGGEDESDEGEQAQPIMGWDDVTSKMLAGVFWGYAVGECLWERDGREIRLDRVKVKKQRRFGFAPGGAIRLLTTANPLGEPLPRRKFWSFTTGADDHDDPYGLGLAHWLYWPVLFKRQDIKFWLGFVEKWTQPTTVGRFPPNATASEKARLLQAARAVATDTGVILPDGMALELLEAARSGASDYDALCERMDGAISKVTLGHSAVADATPGRLGGENLAADVRVELIKADADLSHNSFNVGPARWLTDWNYPGAAYPRVYRRIEDDPDLKLQAECDKLLFDMGYRITPERVRETYGEGFVPKQPERPDGMPGGMPATPPGDAAFAEAIERLADPDEAALAALDGPLDDQAAQALADPMLGPILALARDDPDGFLGRLAEAFPDMGPEALLAHLEKMLFLSEIIGRLGAGGQTVSVEA